MVGEDRVIMSVKELRRVHVIRQTMEKKLTQVKAGTLLGLTTRHIRRLIERVEQAGRPGAGASGTGEAVEPAAPGDGQGQGAAAVCAAVWRFWADVGGGEAGRVPRDHDQ